MNFEHFTDWINDKIPANIFEKQLTKLDYKKNPDIKKELEAIFGCELVHISQSSLETGLCYKTTIDEFPWCVMDGSAAYKIIVDNKWLKNTGKDAIVPLSDGNTIKIHVTDKKPEKAGAKYVIPSTELQESVTAVILTMNVRNMPLKYDKNAVIPMPLDKRGKPVKYKRSELEEWFLSSSPSKKTGICQYIDFHVTPGDDLVFLQELESTFLRGTPQWIKAFDKIWKADIKNLINSVFKTPIKEWNKAIFGYYNIRTLSGAMRETINHYLSNNRYGQKKDTADKSDIVLYFNDQDAITVMNLAMKAKNVEEHNTILNEAFCQKKLLGISLKKIVDDVNIAAANFDPKTTAVGDEIVEDKQLVVKYFGRTNADEKNNTFKFVNPGSDIKISDKPSSGIICNLNNKKDIGAEGNSIVLDVRSAGSLKIEFRETGHPAYGNAGEPLKLPKPYPEYNASDRMNILLDNGCPINEIYKKLSKEIAEIFAIKPLALHAVFAYAAGFPLKISTKTEKQIIITNAPYLKLY